MQTTHPIWLRAVSRPGALVFALMFTLESLARSMLQTVIPYQAFALLKETRDVSLLYFIVSVSGLVGSFTIPLLIRRFRRRWVYSAGVLSLILAAALLATGTLVGQVSGMLIRAYGVAALNITLSLYVMDYIAKRDLVRSEPLRLGFSCASWAAGPFIGVYLNDTLGNGTAEAVSAASAAVLLGYFWLLRLRENPAVAAATKPPPNPFHSIGRFVAQPRLRLAWIIPFGRSCWWSMYTVYPPLFLVQAGEGKLLGALLFGAGNALLILAPVIGRLASRVGLRRVIIAAFMLSGSLTILASTLIGFPRIAALCLLAGALGAVTLDSVGNIPFLRSVHPYERPQMTTVFRTNTDLSDLLPNALFAVLLSFFDLHAVFIATGLWMFVVAGIARYLPRRM